jgi:hypothetical protein
VSELSLARDDKEISSLIAQFIQPPALLKLKHRQQPVCYLKDMTYGRGNALILPNPAMKIMY